jgi:manganese efflux pump family protein
MLSLDILFISIGLAMDAFAVSICSGTKPVTRGIRPTFRLAFHFGLFQFLMPIIGWLLGLSAKNYIESADHWIALTLLSFIGIRMIISGAGKGSDTSDNDPSKGMNLILLSIATSIDALAVGITFAMLNVQIWYPALVIGIVTGILSLTGVQLGNKLGIKFGKNMEIIGGIVLILIGIKILIEHLS